jgi:RND family efflux transporter MFP subunit
MGSSLVETTTIKKEVVNPLDEFIGTLKFSKSAKVASSTSGVVLKVNFEAGDIVKRGDILVEVESDILDSKIESAAFSVELAKIELDNSSKDLDRYKELINKNSISQKLYDDTLFRFNLARENLNLAKAKLNELKIEKEKKSIKSAFDGVVVSKDIEISEWATQGRVVATIVDRAEVDIIFNLPTSYSYKLSKDEKYSIYIKDRKIESKLYANIVKGDIKSRTFPVKFKARVDDEFIYDGMEAKIELPRDKKRSALVVPRDAVIKRFGQNVIFLDSDGIATMIPVQIIGYTKDSIAVSGNGIEEGQKVVVKGNERIFPKQPIKSINK